MTTIHQLNPPFHLWIPEAQDHGLALFLIDYHVEEHLYWVCAMQKTGEIWMLSNDKVRADVNRSIGRTLNKDGVKLFASPHPDSWQLQDHKVAETLTWKANSETQQQNIPKDTNWKEQWKAYNPANHTSTSFNPYALKDPAPRTTGSSGLSGQQVPSSLRVREPKVHLDVPPASGDRKGEDPSEEETNRRVRQFIKNNFADRSLGLWQRTNVAAGSDDKGTRRKGPHKAKHNRRAKSSKR